MKLYTEKQMTMFLEWSRMKDALRSGEILFTPEKMLELFESKICPIQTPSEDDIYSEARRYENYTKEMNELEAVQSASRYHGFMQGANWVKEQINNKLK